MENSTNPDRMQDIEKYATTATLASALIALSVSGLLFLKNNSDLVSLPVLVMSSVGGLVVGISGVALAVTGIARYADTFSSYNKGGKLALAFFAILFATFSAIFIVNTALPAIFGLPLKPEVQSTANFTGTNNQIEQSLLPDLKAHLIEWKAAQPTAEMGCLPTRICNQSP